MTTKYFQPELAPRSAGARRAAGVRWMRRGIEMFTAGDETRSAPVGDEQDAPIRTFCVECAEDFIITPGQREWLLAKGLAPFKRCPACRAARKQRAQTESR
jgi:hypothetical protein